MFSILVSEKGGDSKRLDFDKPEVTIGRVQGNDIILPKGNVSKRHSRIVLKDGKFIIVDLKSTNGTYVNGRKITSPLVVKSSDKVYIGDFILAIEEAGASAPAEEAAPPVRPRTQPPQSAPPPPPRRPADPEEEEDAPPPPASMEGHEAEADSTVGRQDDEPEDEEEAPPAPSPRRPVAPPPAQGIPTMRPQPSPIAQPPRAAEPPRPSVTRDGPAIAPSRPIAPPRPSAPAPVASAPSPASARPRPIGPPPPAAPARRPPAPAHIDGGADASRRGRIIDALRSLSAKLVATLGTELDSLHGDALRERAETVANDLVAELAQDTGLPPGIEPDQLLRDAVGEVVGLGPLDELLLDESVTTITIAKPDRIFVDRAGQGRSLAPRWFSSGEAAHRILDRIARRSGRGAELAEARARGGLFEARLDGGFLLSAALGPLASGSMSMVVRRSRRDGSRLSDLTSQGVLSQGMADFLDLAVRARRNILVAGATGSGRSTLMGALARSTDGQRFVFVEESAELDAGDQPWISLSGAGGDARRAFAAALRLKPERIAVGDIRGAEALDILSAVSGGIDGALLGIAATSTREALRRLVSSARLAAEAPETAALDAEVPNGVHLVVLLQRAVDGESRITEIAEVVSGEAGSSATAIFSARGEGANARFTASGHIPGWAEGAPASMFRA